MLLKLGGSAAQGIKPSSGPCALWSSLRFGPPWCGPSDHPGVVLRTTLHGLGLRPSLDTLVLRTSFNTLVLRTSFNTLVLRTSFNTLNQTARFVHKLWVDEVNFGFALVPDGRIRSQNGIVKRDVKPSAAHQYSLP